MSPHPSLGNFRVQTSNIRVVHQAQLKGLRVLKQSTREEYREIGTLQTSIGFKKESSQFLEKDDLIHDTIYLVCLLNI